MPDNTTCAEDSSVPEHKSVISRDVLAAYDSAHYSFTLDGEQIDLRISQPCPRLAALIADAGSPGAFCITAYNPEGDERTPQENVAANLELRAALEHEGVPFLPAFGKDPSGVWTEEPGFLVLGLTRSRAAELGRRFQQNALVWSNADGVPELLLLR